MIHFILKNAGSRLAAMFLVAALAGILLVLAPWDAGGVAAQSWITPPTVSDTSQFKNHDAIVGQWFSLTLPAADAGSGSGGPYEYSLKTRSSSRLRVHGLSFNAHTRTISGYPERARTYRLSYRIHDSDGNRGWSDAFRAETNLQITVAADRVPTVSDTSQFKNHAAAAGRAFSLTLPAANAGSGNGGPYEYSLWKRGAGKFGENGLTFDPTTRTVSGTPSAGGTYLLAYQVHDADANRDKADSFVAETNLQITVAPPEPPTVADTSQFKNHDAVVWQEFSLTLPAADAGSGNGESYEYILWKRGAGVHFGENGLTFDPKTRTVSGTPVASGTHQLAYQIHDADADRSKADSFVAETNLQITVAFPPLSPPTVADASQFKNHDALVAHTFSLTLPAADADSGSGGPYEYILWKRGAGEFGENGLTFDPTTRTVSGTPAATGTHQLAYQIHDADADRRKEDSFVAETNLQITVSPAPPPAPPTVSDTSQFRNHYVFAEQAFSLTLPAADADSGGGGPYEYTLWRRGAGKFEENGLTFDPQTRTVSGTTVVAGIIPLAYQIHDADADRRKEDSFVAETNLQITVLPPPPIPPTVADASQFRNHQATVGQAFSVTLPAADAGSGNGGPYEYILRKRGDSRPFGEYGLSFNPETREVSGTPTAPGTHLLTYLIHDADLDRRTSDTFVWEGDLQITVTAPAGWTAPAPAVPTVSDQSQLRNHDAAIGQAFSLTLPAADAGSGNGGPYEYILWKQGAGVHFGENGLKFNPETREISGTPVVPGVFQLAYQIHDGDADRSESDSFVAETNLQITVPSSGSVSSSAPPVPTGLEVYVTDGAFSLSWDPVPGATGYFVQISTGIPGYCPPLINGTNEQITNGSRDVGWAWVRWVDARHMKGANQTYRAVVNTVCGVGHNFRVSAYGGRAYGRLNAAAMSHYSAPVTMTTPPCLRPSPDQTPAFDEGANATRQLAENSPAGTSVGPPVTATAADGDTLSYWMQGADAVFFNLDTATAQLTAKAGVDYDYETKRRYALTVVAANGRGGYSTIRVTVNLTDVNEAPVFGEGAAATREVVENSPAGTRVGAPVSATDPDGDTLTYSLSGTDAASFAIGAGTGQITTIADVTYDYDTKPSYSLTVEASDGKLSASIAVTVSLTELNHPPVFGEGATTTREVVENSPAGTNVGAPVLATDPDDDTLAYGLSGTDANSFEIDSATGQLTTTPLVTATKSSYSVTVEASDGKGGTASIAVTVNLTEDTNAAPVFRAVRSLPENSPAGTNVGWPVAAFDPDDDSLTYSLSGQDGSSFEIDPATGQLKTKTGVTYDHETKPSYTVSVTASDSRNGVAAIDVTIHVTDEEEEAPTHTLEPKVPTAGVPPNTPATGAPAITGTVQVDRTLTADTSGIADDNGLTNVSYGYQWLSGKDTAISGATNSTYLLQTSDAGKTIKVRVTFTDDDGYEETLTSAATAPVAEAATGDVTGEDDEPANRAPSFAASSATRSVAENSPAGTNVGLPITATDPDEGDTLTYSLSGTDASLFEIGGSTGQIITKTGETYDFETDSSYSLTVEATDGKLSASIAVTVDLNDVNEAPAFGANVETTLEVAENSAAGTNVGAAFTATDPDAGDTLTYSLSGTDASSFTIGGSTGQITTIADVTYDYETDSSYSLTVEASDGKLSASIAVTVDLNDVNEAPAFAAASATLSVNENSAAGTNVGAAVTATDPDAGDTLTYSLSGTDASSFAIGGSTGQITTKSDETYDYEAKKSYSLTVEAEDGNGGTASIAVTVNLTDVGTPVAACKTDLGILSATAEYAGKWDDAECKAHHQDSLGRYFQFTVSAETEVSISLSAGALYVSKDTPDNGWGTEPGGGYEHRREVRRGNGKLVHDGPHSATAQNDGNTVTLTLEVGPTYTVEAANPSGDFTVNIAPQ